MSTQQIPFSYTGQVQQAVAPQPMIPQAVAPQPMIPQAVAPQPISASTTLESLDAKLNKIMYDATEQKKQMDILLANFDLLLQSPPNVSQVAPAPAPSKGVVLPPQAGAGPEVYIPGGTVKPAGRKPAQRKPKDGKSKVKGHIAYYHQNKERLMSIGECKTLRETQKKANEEWGQLTPEQKTKYECMTSEELEKYKSKSGTPKPQSNPTLGDSSAAKIAFALPPGNPVPPQFPQGIPAGSIPMGQVMSPHVAPQTAPVRIPMPQALPQAQPLPLPQAIQNIADMQPPAPQLVTSEVGVVGSQYPVQPLSQHPAPVPVPVPIQSTTQGGLASAAFPSQHLTFPGQIDGDASLSVQRFTGGELQPVKKFAIQQ
jgi:hypothetical protein